jgi:DNA-binding HxlR family transcriptional regulator
MTAVDVLVKNAPSGNLVSERIPPSAPPDPYAAGCPTRMLLDRIGDKWMVLTLSLIRDKPRRFNALRRDIEGVTQKMLSQTLKQMERDGLVTRTVLPNGFMTEVAEVRAPAVLLGHSSDRRDRIQRRDRM